MVRRNRWEKREGLKCHQGENFEKRVQLIPFPPTDPRGKPFGFPTAHFGVSDTSKLKITW